MKALMIYKLLKMLPVLVLLITGVIGAGFFGRRLVGLYESVLNRIPLVRSVYSALKQFMV